MFKRLKEEYNKRNSDYINIIINENLRMKSNQDLDFNLCKCCMNNVPNFVSISCGHFNFCNECKTIAERKKMKCPICRENIIYLRIYQ